MRIIIFLTSFIITAILLMIVGAFGSIKVVAGSYSLSISWIGILISLLVIILIVIIFTKAMNFISGIFPNWRMGKMHREEISSNHLLEEGFVHLMSGNIVQAEKIAIKILQKEKYLDVDICKIYHAQLASLKGDIAKASVIFQELVEKKSKYQLLGLLFLSKNCSDEEKKILYMKKARDLSPKNPFL